MDFAAALYTFLSTHAGITAQVSDRVHPIQAPSSPTYPLLVFREMYTEEAPAMQQTDTLIRPSYEIEAHAVSHAAVRTVMRAVEAALRDYSGSMTTCDVQAVFITGGAEDYEPDGQYYWRSKEFQFFVTEG